MFLWTSNDSSHSRSDPVWKLISSGVKQPHKMVVFEKMMDKKPLYVVILLQSTVVISTSIITNNRLSRRENLDLF